MTLNRVATVTLSALLWAPLLAPAAKADEWDKKTVVTFGQPVEVPGRVLPPGEYVVKLADVQSDRDVVEFYTKDEKRIVATVIGIADYRDQPSDQPTITFEERAKGAPEAIKSWFFPGDTSGVEFVYPKVHPTQLARNAGQSTLLPARTSPREQPLAVTPRMLMPRMPMMAMNKPAAPAEVKQSRPVETAQAARPPEPGPAATSAPKNSKLPHTAGSVPLLTLLGLASLGAGAGLGMIRRRCVV